MPHIHLEPNSRVSLPDPLPQFVPGSACFQCEVCCRFPESDSFLRPYFTRDEIGVAVAVARITAMGMQFIGTMRVRVGLMAVDMLVIVRMRVPMRVFVGMHQIAVAMLVKVEMLVRMFMMMLVSVTVRLTGRVAVF